ncbi:MAG: hypothetical protein AAB531_00390 [Patescibacteria group bacterium]
MIEPRARLPFVPIKERQIAQHDQIQSTCDGLLRHFGIRELMEEVQSATWTQGELLWIPYTSRKFDGELTPPDFSDVPVGFALETEFPSIIASYSRNPLGSAWSDGVECRPGSIKGRGYHTVYGELEFKGARIENSFTQFDIVVRPRWNENDPMRISQTSPVGYDLLVENWRLPSGNKPVKSARGLMRRKIQDNELYEYEGDGGIFPNRLPNPAREIKIGLTGGDSVVIDVGDSQVRYALEKEIEEQIEVRRKIGGLPTEMIARAKELISLMPEEFQSNGSGTKEDFERWAKAA